MDEPTIRDDLIAAGATATDRGDYVVACPTFEMLIRIEGRADGTRLVFLAPVAEIAERDLPRCLESTSFLLIGVPVVIAGTLLVRSVLPIEEASREVLGDMIAALASDTVMYEAAIRQRQSPYELPLR